MKNKLVSDKILNGFISGLNKTVYKIKWDFIIKVIGDRMSISILDLYISLSFFFMWEII